MLYTPLCELLQIEYPILQGALGPHDTSELAIAVCRAGGLGVLSSVETEDIYCETRRQIQKLKGVGSPFGVNIPVKSPGSSKRLQAVLDELNMDSQVRQTLRVVITSAGGPEWCADELRHANVHHFHVVASVKHARKAADAGCRGLIAEGHESGGHVASNSGVTTITLVPAVVEEVGIPVVAAGGLVDGAGLVAALALGAVGIQMGTRLLMTTEATFIHRNIRSALLQADISDTVVVPGVYGENRHWRNDYTDKLLDAVSKHARESEISQLKTKGRQAKYSGEVRGASIPIGMAVGRIRSVLTVQEVVENTMAEAKDTIFQLKHVFDQGGSR